MSVVVDANLVISVLVGDEHSRAAHARLASWLEVGEQLHAPAVLPYEIANVLARLAFDGELILGELREIWHDVAALELHLHPFDLIDDGPAVASVTAELRRRHATDSAYVRLAQRLGTELWTLDGALTRNAAGAGLPVQLAGTSAG